MPWPYICPHWIRRRWVILQPRSTLIENANTCDCYIRVSVLNAWPFCFSEPCHVRCSYVNRTVIKRIIKIEPDRQRYPWVRYTKKYAFRNTVFRLLWGFNDIRRSESVFPWSDMPIAERADETDMIVLYIFKCNEGDQLNWLLLRVLLVGTC